MLENIDFLCVGSFSVELLAWVERYPGAGDAIYASKNKWTGGGMATNLAHAVARLGGAPALVTVIGDDGLGNQAIEQLRLDGVEVDYVVRRENQSSPMVLLMVDPELRRAGLVLGLPEAAILKPTEVPDELIRASRIYFTDMQPPGASIQVAKRAKTFGLVVAFDMQMTEKHLNIPGLNQQIDKLFAIADYYFADEENFLDWVGEKDILTGCRALFQDHPEKTLVITKGVKGSVIATQSAFIEIPAFQVPVVDTIGAGDAYHGAFLYAHLILGKDLEEAGLLGSAAAALSCTQAGARDGLPTMDEVIELMKNGKRYPQ